MYVGISPQRVSTARTCVPPPPVKMQQEYGVGSPVIHKLLNFVRICMERALAIDAMHCGSRVFECGQRDVLRPSHPPENRNMMISRDTGGTRVGFVKSSELSHAL